ncbi:MAG: hypothetical protein JXQ69_05165 [Paludibacteraceae bacterium]|nr:hypothetical protein [Paludibacteraceae bacterium]MBN2787700.1 hypothetical protein [Paludibacteraceae bacterium]
MNTKNLISKSAFAVILLFSAGTNGTIFSQEKAPIEAEIPLVNQLQSEFNKSKLLKISGYVQAQYQLADTAGISSFAGGNFGKGTNNRFMVRRGRIKLTYDNKFSKAVLQFDMTEKGLGIKDAYVTITEPWLKTISLTGGIFDRPFGYEISYSSSVRETPERSRVYQTLFPGERDLGGKLSFQAPKTSNWNLVKLEVGLLNGNGPNVETDAYKDISGRLSVSKTSSSKKFSWGLGSSYYIGGFSAKTDSLYTTKKVNEQSVFVKDSIAHGSKLDREYIGFDGQVSVNWWLGKTQVRAEYLLGTQTSTEKSSSSLTAAINADAYSRNFEGYYVYFIQDIFKTALQAVVKYDVYDPNIHVAGNTIGLPAPTDYKKTGEADIKYATLGIGLNYQWNKHVKIMAYYDMVTNETTINSKHDSTLKDLSKDRKDNVFTLRVQYKF